MGFRIFGAQASGRPERRRPALRRAWRWGERTDSSCIVASAMGRERRALSCTPPAETGRKVHRRSNPINRKPLGRPSMPSRVRPRGPERDDIRRGFYPRTTSGPVPLYMQIAIEHPPRIKPTMRDMYLAPHLFAVAENAVGCAEVVKWDSSWEARY